MEKLGVATCDAAFDQIDVHFEYGSHPEQNLTRKLSVSSQVALDSGATRLLFDRVECDKYEEAACFAYAKSWSVVLCNLNVR